MKSRVGVEIFQWSSRKILPDLDGMRASLKAQGARFVKPAPVALGECGVWGKAPILVRGQDPF